ncbi:hypothetical protein D3C85_734470 [compost metagenome]
MDTRHAAHGQEAFGGQFRPVQIAERHTAAADIQFAGDALRKLTQVLAQDVEANVVERTAERNAGVALRKVDQRARIERGGRHRDLGRAIDIDQGIAVAPAFQPAVDVAPLHRFAADHHKAQAVAGTVVQVGRQLVA